MVRQVLWQSVFLALLRLSFASKSFVLGSIDRFVHCAFEIVMVDDRPWNRISLNNAPYWVSAAVVNFAYAQHFGYDFTFVRPRLGGDSGTYPGWHKVMYIAERLRSQRRAVPIGPQQCSWLVYMDGDAFVREQGLPLPFFLSSLASRYRGFSDATGAVFAAEHKLDWTNLTRGALPENNPEAPFLNTGVFFARADAPHAGGTSTAVRLFDAWLDAAAHVVHRRLWTSWPGEQGILSELVRPGSYPEAQSQAKRSKWLRKSVLVVNLTEMNSPWGRFIQHSWGRKATETFLRSQALGDALLRAGLAEPATFASFVREVQSMTVHWDVWPYFSGLS